MTDIKDHRRSLYNAIKDKFKVSNETDDEKAFAEFDTKMNDPVSRQKFYDHVSKTFNIGTWDEFEQRIAPATTQPVQGTGTLDKMTFGGNKPASPTPFTQMKPAASVAQPVTGMQPQDGSTQNTNTGEATGTVAGEATGTVAGKTAVTQPQTETASAQQQTTGQKADLYQSYEEAHPEKVQQGIMQTTAAVTPEDLAARQQQQHQERAAFEASQRMKRAQARRRPVQEFYTAYMKPVFDKIRQRGKQQIAEAARLDNLTQRMMGSPTMAVNTQSDFAKEKYDDPQKVIDEVLNQFMPPTERMEVGKQTSGYETAQRVRTNRMMTQLVYNQIGMNPDASEKDDEAALRSIYNSCVEAGISVGDEASFMRNIRNQAWREKFYDENLKGKVGFTLEQFNNEVDPPQLNEDELRKIQNRYNTEFNELTSDLQQLMLDEYKKEEAPKNWLEYIAGNAMRENMVGKLLDILNQKAAGSSGLRRQLRREATQQFGEDSNWFVRTAGELSPLFVDTAIQLPFLLPGLAGRGVAMGLQQIGGALVKNNATAQLANLSRSAAFAQWLAETSAVKRAATNMAVRSLSSAANFAVLNAQNYAMEAWGNGQFSTDEFAESVWEGVKTGLGAGVVGNIFGKKFNSKMGNVFMQTGGVMREQVEETLHELKEMQKAAWDDLTESLHRLEEVQSRLSYVEGDLQRECNEFREQLYAQQQQLARNRDLIASKGR